MCRARHNHPHCSAIFDTAAVWATGTGAMLSGKLHACSPQQLRTNSGLGVGMRNPKVGLCFIFQKQISAFVHFLEAGSSQSASRAYPRNYFKKSSTLREDRRTENSSQKILSGEGCINPFGQLKQGPALSP